MGHLTREGEKVYFTDGGGAWRVYDVPFESPHANYRWFVAGDGTQRCHRFERGDSRALTEATVGDHLHRAGHMALERFDPMTHMPR